MSDDQKRLRAVSSVPAEPTDEQMERAWEAFRTFPFGTLARTDSYSVARTKRALLAAGPWGSPFTADEIEALLDVAETHDCECGKYMDPAFRRTFDSAVRKLEALRDGER